MKMKIQEVLAEEYKANQRNPKQKKIIFTLKYINRHMHEASTAEEVLIQRVSYCCPRHWQGFNIE